MKSALGIIPALFLITTLCSAQESSGTKKISFLLKNDIHGHLEPSISKSGKTFGGLSTLASITEQMRAQPEYQNGNAAFYILDSGDQFQGTLLSHFDEGLTVFKAFNKIGYDAIIPGNHDYDFGPLGWLYDRVIPGKTSDNPREVIEGLSKIATFPMLSANTYLRASIFAKGDRTKVEVDAQCRPARSSLLSDLDFENAAHPAFLKSYVILNKAGVRVALVGLDHHNTTATTTAVNVSDLCFRDETETYLEIRKSLEGLADIFVIMIHNGNTDNTKEASDITRKINSQYANGVNLVAAGHTHYIHDDSINGVHVMQDGAEAKNFGRVDLIWDPSTHTVVQDQTQSKAGIPIDRVTCNQGKPLFACDQYTVPVPNHSGIDALIQDLRTMIAPLAKEKIATAQDRIYVDRISESPLADILTDALRKGTGTQISFMNTGGIRTSINPGEVLYENFFEVIPFSNMAVVMDEMPWSGVKKLLERSITTCGRFGALMQSGLKVTYSRTCEKGQDVSTDAKLLSVATIDGEVLFDDQTTTSDTRKFKISTLDFLASGGDQFEGFKETRITATLGIARDIIANQLIKDGLVLTKTMDDRMKNISQTKVIETNPALEAHSLHSRH